MKKCERCGRENCAPKYFRLCPECLGHSCNLCSQQLVPGIVEGQDPDGGNIIVCSEWADPEVDAVIDDTRESLIACVTAARNEIIKDN